MSMYEELKQVFKEDCTDSRGYTEEEADKLWDEHGESFLEDMIEDLWTNWSENFPIEEKDK